MTASNTPVSLEMSLGGGQVLVGVEVYQFLLREIMVT